MGLDLLYYIQATENRNKKQKQNVAQKSDRQANNINIRICLVRIKKEGRVSFFILAL